MYLTLRDEEEFFIESRNDFIEIKVDKDGKIQINKRRDSK